MGQKINPSGLRIGIIKDWESKWESQSESGYDYYETIKELKKLKTAKALFSHNLKYVKKTSTDIQQYILATSQCAIRKPYLRQKIIA